MSENDFNKIKSATSEIPALQDDRTAKQENNSFENKIYDKVTEDDVKLYRNKLTKDNDEQEHNRKNGVLQLTYQLIRFALIFIFILLIALLASWFWHILTPDCFHYLSADQIEKVQGMIVSGSLSGALATAYKTFLSSNK